MEVFSRSPGKKVCSYLVQKEGDAVRKYRHFKNFLDGNHAALNIIAELEQMYHSGRPFSLNTVRKHAEDLMESLRSLVEAMGEIAGGKYAGLHPVVRRIEEELSRELPTGRSVPVTEVQELVVPLARVTPEMMEYVGAKAGNLATVGNTLELPVPPGFVATANAGRFFAEDNGLVEIINRELSRLSRDSTEDLETACSNIRNRILGAEVPEKLAKELLSAFDELENSVGSGVHIAMRSSAVGEDTEASFAGQYTTVLNVGREDLLEAYKTVLASKYNDRAVFYRLQNGLEDEETPMCVFGLAMVNARASGVIYTVDPSSRDASVIRISSVWGLGELLVSGESSPDTFEVRKEDHRILQRQVAHKEKRLVMLPQGGHEEEEVPEADREVPSLSDAAVVRLALYASRLEEFFQSPQDIEWAQDQEGNLFILQSRPLGLAVEGAEAEEPGEFEGHPIIFSGGKTASLGVAAGPVFIVRGNDITGLPEDAVLVARTASPDYARLMNRVAGVITDLGSVASHLASVAREFGVPALVDAKDATSKLPPGDLVTLNAGTATVYRGVVSQLIDDGKPSRKNISQSPVHRRMRRVLDKISPLNLTDPEAPTFAPEGCRTVHDVIRFLHEKIMKEMFSMVEDADQDLRSQKLEANIPLAIHFLDLGGGLREGLTTCDPITPDDIESVPMKALWKGLTHPGINWSSSIGFTAENLARVMLSGAMSDMSDVVGTDSYAVVSHDYLNLSAKFGYHFANLDALCTQDSNQNHINFQFSGGVGTYYGRSLRVLLLANILERLDFTIKNNGDYLGAFLAGHDLETTLERLNQMGRMLACSRLLDVALRSEGDVDRLTEMFFNGDYDFLAGKSEEHIQNFYIFEGHWMRAQEEGREVCYLDGSREVDPLSRGLACFLGTLTLGRYQSFLNNIRAYHYFPLAIAKNSDISSGEVSVRVKCVRGCIDMAGGLAFAMENAGNYLVMRVDALKNDVVLYQFVNNRPSELAKARVDIEPDRWYTLTVRLKGTAMEGYLDGERVLEYQGEEALEGFVGLWGKADSGTYFDELVLRSGNDRRVISFRGDLQDIRSGDSETEGANA